MLKTLIINNLMKLIAKDNNLDEIKLQEIKYGLEAIYLNVTKIGAILVINIILGNFISCLLILLFYTPIKAFGWGFHAKTSLQCWIASLIAFVGLPVLVNHLYFDIYSKAILSVFFLLAIWCWAPADTPKRPLVNPVTRKKLRLGAIFITLIYIVLIFYTPFSNYIILALLLQVIVINPFTYLTFNTPYRNYLYYKVNQS